MVIVEASSHRASSSGRRIWQNGVLGGETLPTAGYRSAAVLEASCNYSRPSGGVRRINLVLPRLSVISY